MKARDIFIKTMPFVWAKLILWLATIAASIIWFALLALIAAAVKSSGLYVIIVILWIVGTRVAHFILMRYFGYLIKAGHIAVITETVITGRVPENQIEYGKQAVTERFATANVYFVIDRLVSGAVKQIQRVVGRVGNLFKFIPGMKALTNIAQLFVEISLGYIDECCLGYTFYMRDQSAFKSAADGVVIFAQNWKKLLANAAKITLKVILIMIVVVVIFSLIFSAILNLISNLFIVGLAAFIFACFMAMAVKSAFLDSYILVQTMTVYMQIAPETVITYNLYDKLCGLSRKFKELFNKAREEQPFPYEPEPAGAAAAPAATAGTYGAFGENSGGVTQGGAQPRDGEIRVFCTNCGNRIIGDVKFCGNCGSPVS
jgi:hypothetical protein